MTLISNFIKYYTNKLISDSFRIFFFVSIKMTDYQPFEATPYKTNF
jgi:hypothetical protein